MKDSKIIAFILKDKKFLNSELIADLKEKYCDYLEDSQQDLKPKIKTKTNYIGIEIECFTKYDRFEIMEKLIELDLQDMVQAVDDGSIEPNFGDALELRVLIPEKKLAAGLKKLSKLFVKGKFGVNDTCGLHIHLDMRNRDVNKCYEKLLKCQDMLFAMVKRERWNNEYCRYTVPLVDRYERYVAINKGNAYLEHKTIEIRLHHGTLDMKQVEKWVNLLLRVIGSRTPPPVNAKVDVLKWAKKQKGLNAYIKKNLNEKWFERKKQVASGDHETHWED